MAINFANLSELVIPEGSVMKITSGSSVLWEKPDPIKAMLIDWEYTESNGTYTLTAWKGTKNGVASTECVVPDYSNVIL